MTAGGENVAPVPIEDRIKEELPIVSNVVVGGDRMKYLVHTPGGAKETPPFRGSGVS